MNNHAMEVIVITVMVAMVAQVLAVRFKLPSILLWLLLGMLLGPFGLHVIKVDVVEGALQPLIELGLAIILFEGGLNLNLRSLKEYGHVIGRIVVLGPLITTAIGGYLIHQLTSLGWNESLLLGAIISISGPTVIMPLVRQVRMERKLRHILTGEAMVVDAIGAILAIIMLQFALEPGNSFSSFLPDLLFKFLIGIGLGWLGGIALSMLLNTHMLKDAELRTMTTLASVWGLFALAEHVSQQAGLLTVLVLGVIMQRKDLPDLQRLKHFKASLSILLVSILFVLLAARLDLSVLVESLVPGIIVFLALAFVIRPLTILLSCFGADLQWRHKIYLSAMAPKGVVAAAIASMFSLVLSNNGFEFSDQFTAIVYLVIIFSVLIYGVLASPMSKWLQVTGSDDRSVLIVGGGQIGAELGRALSEDREVRFIDLNAEVVGNLQRQGYTAIRGNALDPLVLEIARAEEMSNVIILTGSSDHNLLIAQLVSEEYNINELYITLQEGDEEKHARLMHQVQARRLFGKPYHFTYWNDQAYRKRLVFESRTVESISPLIGHKLMDIRIPHGVQPLAIVRDGKSMIPHDDVVLQENDEFRLLLRPERIQEGQPLLLPPASDTSHIIRSQQIGGSDRTV